jgi:hypothetical protein
MKNLILILSILIFPFIASAVDEPWQGDVEYEITYEGEGADYMEMIGFSGYHYFFGDNIVRLKLTGGMAYLLNDFIINRATDKTVMIDDVDQVVYHIEDEDETEEADSGEENSVVVKTKAKEKILGYKCTKYIVTTTTDSSEKIVEYWTTPKINVSSIGDIDLVNGLTFAGVEGFPLRIVWMIDGLTMKQEATSVNNYSPSASLFEIPPTYAVKDFSESPLMQLMDEETEEE